MSKEIDSLTVHRAEQSPQEQSWRMASDKTFVVEIYNPEQKNYTYYVATNSYDLRDLIEHLLYPPQKEPTSAAPAPATQEQVPDDEIPF